VIFEIGIRIDHWTSLEMRLLTIQLNWRSQTGIFVGVKVETVAIAEVIFIQV